MSCFFTYVYLRKIVLHRETSKRYKKRKVQKHEGTVHKYFYPHASYDAQDNDCFYTMMTMTTTGGKDGSVSTDLIDLTLKVVHHLGWHVFAQNLEEIDPLVAGDRFVSGQFDALLNLLYSRVLRDQIGVLSLPYRLVTEDLPVLLRIRRDNTCHEQRAQHYRVKSHLRAKKKESSGWRSRGHATIRVTRCAESRRFISAIYTYRYL